MPYLKVSSYNFPIHCLSRWHHIYGRVQKLSANDVTCTPSIVEEEVLLRYIAITKESQSLCSLVPL